MSGFFFFFPSCTLSAVGGRSSGSPPSRCSATGVQIDVLEVEEETEEEEEEESVGVQQFYTYSCPELAKFVGL